MTIQYIRVEYTNLLGSREMTDSPTRRENRGMDGKIYNQDEWRAKFQRARSRSKKLRTREEPTKCE